MEKTLSFVNFSPPPSFSLGGFLSAFSLSLIGALSSRFLSRGLERSSVALTMLEVIFALPD